ncbi:MAG: InlB B-repeat-containing protein [Clostridia bacterium]|nr:InlB B-repeat-containing protein [Clostridia bacterium]
MKKRYLILLALLALTLTCLLSGCGKGEQDLEGMYVATFEINGGKLNLGTSDVTTKINFAYEPGALVMDPTVRIGSGETSSLGYAISRAGYNFTGWYTGPECLPEQKWDFATGTINAEKLTLYAGWEKQIVYTYTVCYTDGANTVALGSYNVKPGATFDDYRKYATLRDDYTPIGYFADAACQTPWDATTVHPGGEQDTDISVFVDYIPGEWLIVDSYTKLKSAIGKGNIYLTANIDCEGKELTFGDWKYVLEGNGFAIDNFTVNKYGTSRTPVATIFKSLKAGAEVRNVSFTNVTFNYKDVSDATTSGGTITVTRKMAALAGEGADCKVTNVTVSGKLITNYEGELPRLNEVFYDETGTNTITSFSAAIVVEKQS